MNIKRFALGPLETNGYLVFDHQGNAVFIDPAAETLTVIDWIKKNNIELKAVLLTHGHIDHVAGLGESSFSDIIKGEIYLNSGDSEMVMYPPRGFAQSLGFNFDGISSLKDIKDGDELSFGDLRVKVISTPGHTEGSVCFLIKEENKEESALFSGDTLFAQGIGRTDLPGGDFYTLEKSLIKLASLAPELAVYPGHGPSTTISDEMRKNPFWPRR